METSQLKTAFLHTERTMQWSSERYGNFCYNLRSEYDDMAGSTFKYLVIIMLHGKS